MQIIESNNPSRSFPSDLKHEKWVLKRIGLKEIKNNLQLGSILQGWSDFWEFPPFHSLIQVIDQSSALPETKMEWQFFLQLDNHQHLLSFLAFNLLNVDLNASSPAKLSLTWLVNPIEFQKKTQDYAVFISDYLIDCLSPHVISTLGLERSTLAFMFFEFPQTAYTKKFANLFSLDLKSQSLTEHRNKWIRYLYPCDQLLNSPSTGEYYRNSYHFLFYFQEFDPHPPKAILRKMEGAIKIMLEYESGFNPYDSQIDSNNFQKFEAILQEKAKMYAIKHEIKQKIDFIRKQRKKIWWRFSLIPPRNIDSYAKKFAENAAENLKLLYNQGFRIKIFKVKSREGQSLISHYLPSLALACFETIDSEGSLYAKMTKDDGALNLDFYSVEFFSEVLGEYAAFLEYRSLSGEIIFAGWAQSSYKKPVSPYTSQMYASLILPALFRGAALAQILTAFSIEPVEKRKHFDFILEDNTNRNIRTTKLVDRLGFHSYGLLDRMMYDITGFTDRKKPICVGFFRRYRFSLHCVEKLMQNSIDPQNMKKLSQDLAMHQSLSEATDRLFEKGILQPILGES